MQRILRYGADGTILETYTGAQPGLQCRLGRWIADGGVGASRSTHVVRDGALVRREGAEPENPDLAARRQARAADRAQVRTDPLLAQLRDLTPDQAADWVQTHTATLADARRLLAALARVVVRDLRREG
jgi:hypothetical protein